MTRFSNVAKTVVTKKRQKRKKNAFCMGNVGFWGTKNENSPGSNSPKCAYGLSSSVKWSVLIGDGLGMYLGLSRPEGAAGDGPGRRLWGSKGREKLPRSMGETPPVHGLEPAWVGAGGNSPGPWSRFWPVQRVRAGGHLDVIVPIAQQGMVH